MMTPFAFAVMAVIAISFVAFLLLQEMRSAARVRDELASITAITAGADLEALLVDPSAIPVVYTGQLVDVDADGVADVALFGAPEAPILRPLVEENSGRPDRTPLYAGLVVLAAAIAGPITSQWAKHRWPTANAYDDEDEPGR